MIVKLWGTRGSIPVATRSSRYGGNTTCVEVRTDAGDRIILDAGTGIYALGEAMQKESPSRCTLCFTHTHWDHIQGLPHFAPLYSPNWQIQIMGTAATPKNSSIKRTLYTLFDGRHFPLLWNNLPFSPHVHEFVPGDSFSVGSALVETCPTSHPGGCVAYRITADGWTFVFSGDHECGATGPNTAHSQLARFFKGANVALVDAQYSMDEYQAHDGWGHSAMEHWPALADAAKVNHLVFTHFDPSRTDEQLELMLDRVRHAYAELPLLMQLGYEGMTITSKGGDNRHGMDDTADPLCPLCEFSRRIAGFSDTGTILDSVLHEARGMGMADAGTIYLVDEDRLVFSHTQNDTLFPGSAANKHVYLNASLPLDPHSIAGYVATTLHPLNISDVRALPPNVSYGFNDAFDRATGYRTVSVLTVPLLGSGNQLLGVMQLINSLDQEGVPQTFSLPMQRKVERLAILGATPIERGRMARELILRMLQTAALRDPRETARHVMRVGATAAEIYHRWAELNSVEHDILRATKGRIRLAAMLHDVGKVGIPDAVLKKPGKLTPEERAIVEQHSAMGANLFKSSVWDVEIMARDIALHHHQKWDGTGYTGTPDSPPLLGEEIPLGARITAVADVYDALVSPRCYKEEWDKDKAYAFLLAGAGSHFDPEIVEAFMDIRDVVDAIYNRFPDEEE